MNLTLPEHQICYVRVCRLSKALIRRVDASYFTQRPFTLFPESNVSIPIKKKQSAEFLITGRADWAMGYKSMGDERSLLNAMETKQRSEFPKGEAQLTAYLAILRENSRRAKKVNYRTQGF